MAVLSFAPRLVEPDDYAYRASIVAMTRGHFLTLSTAQLNTLASQLTGGHWSPVGQAPTPVAQWVRLASGRWISEKDPGYPFLAAPFQALGIIRLAPLFYGALGCLGLFFGGRRWLGRFGGAVAVGLFCSSGAALLFAWRDYMPTFTDASLIAAGTGALLWAVLAAEASARRRTRAGLLGFAALEAAAFVRYTDIAVLGCAAVAVALAWRLRAARLPGRAVAWWLGSVVLFGAGVAVFDALVYGGPLRSGYRPGEITFSLSAVLPNFRLMPAHLIEAMPVLALGLASLAWIALRWLRRRRAGAEPAALARRDLGVGLALGASWFSVWGLYAAYTWTTFPLGSTLQVVRFYVPAVGAIALLGAWLVTRVPPRATLAGVTSAAVVVAMFGLGVWSFTGMMDAPFLGMVQVHGRVLQGRAPAGLRHRGGPGGGPAAGPHGGVNLRALVLTDGTPAVAAIGQQLAATIRSQILDNLAWARRNGIPAQPHVLATGEYSGLRILPQQPVDNPNLVAAMGPEQVQWIAMDASREPDMRYVGAALGVPRHPIDVGYDVSTVADEINEFNWLNTAKQDGGSGLCQGSKATACLKPLSPKTGWTSFILPGQVRIVFADVINNDPRPFFMHQSNLTGDRLGYPVMDGLLTAYRAVYGPSAPIVNLPMSGDGVALHSQALWARARRAGGVSAYVQGHTITITGPPGTLMPVTVPAGTRVGSPSGPAFGHPYAGRLSDYVRLGAQPLRLVLGSAPYRSARARQPAGH